MWCKSGRHAALRALFIWRFESSHPHDRFVDLVNASGEARAWRLECCPNLSFRSEATCVSVVLRTCGSVKSASF